MLGKLIKYDMKASTSMLGVCYLAVLILSLLVSGMGRLLSDISQGKDLGIAATLAVTSVAVLWIVSLAGTAIAALIAVLRRFYMNLMGDQGYLTLTLPVKASTHVLSKLISGFAILLVSALVMMLGIGIPALIGVSGDLRQMLLEYTRFSWDVLMREMGFLYIVNQILSMWSGLLLAYLALCVGQLCERHRVLAAIGVCIGVSLLEEILKSAAVVVFSSLTAGRGDMVYYLEHILESSTGIGNTVYLLAQCGLFFWLSSYILEKKANLR